MVEIWIRSIARAGGIEVPASVRVLDPRARTPRASLRDGIARVLRHTGERLVNVSEFLGRPPNRTAPCGGNNAFHNRHRGGKIERQNRRTVWRSSGWTTSISAPRVSA